MDLGLVLWLWWSPGRVPSPWCMVARGRLVWCPLGRRGPCVVRGPGECSCLYFPLRCGCPRWCGGCGPLAAALPSLSFASSLASSPLPLPCLLLPPLSPRGGLGLLLGLGAGGGRGGGRLMCWTDTYVVGWRLGVGVGAAGLLGRGRLAGCSGRLGGA